MDLVISVRRLLPARASALKCRRVDETKAAALANELRKHLAGEVLSAAQEREASSTDFGGMYRVVPQLMARPVSVADVRAAVRFAGEEGLSISTRGMGHSQSGQGLGSGLLLEMTALNRTTAFDASASRIEVEAGATWRGVVDASFGRAMLPVALTYALDTTVGGTLSVGGIGSAAWSYGPQVDNVLYLDIVTADGEVVRCSAESERALFDAARAGLGQCGVIVRAGLPLRHCTSHVRTRAFVYREVRALLGDVERLVAELDPSCLFAVRLGQDPLTPTSLMAVLYIGQFVASADSMPASGGIPPLNHGFEAPTRCDPTWTPEGIPGHPFFRVYGAPHLAPGGSTSKHPWVDFIFSMSSSSTALATLASNTSGLLQQGTSELIFIRRGTQPAPLLIIPSSGLTMGLGMFPTFEAKDAERAALVMQAYEREMRACGGKRYLSGYFGEQASADWSEHYGEMWPGFCAAKARFDPTGRFESPLVKWA